MSEAKVEKVAGQSFEFAAQGTGTASIVSEDEFIRLPTGDLCDRCKSTNQACSLRCEAHQENIQVRSCAHFEGDL